MTTPEMIAQVGQWAVAHCAAKGYVDGPNWNPLVPQDCVAALAMARQLIGSGRYDRFIAVAPEGHVYGYFFERLGESVDSLFVPYPPTEVSDAGDLSRIRGQHVLLIEDDVASGTSLRLILSAFQPHAPATVSLYLGRRADCQTPENIPEGIHETLLAEQLLDPSQQLRYEAEFCAFFEAERALHESGPRGMTPIRQPFT